MPFLACLLLLFAAPPTLAGGEQTLLQNLRTQFPATRVDSVRVTPLPGLYEVRMGNNIAYTNEEGKLWVVGRLYDPARNLDLTVDGPAATASRESRVVTAAAPEKPETWPKTDAIVRTIGNGTRTLIVVTDTDCGYCRRLEADLGHLENVTIYYYPVALLGDGAAAEAAWCARDRVAAWAHVMRGRELIGPDGGCSNPVQRNTDRAIKAGVRGTPTLFRMDGARLSGYQSSQSIAAWLEH